MSLQTPEQAVEYEPIVAKDGGRGWKKVEHAAEPDPSLQLDAAYYVARAVREQRLDTAGAVEIVDALGLDRDTVVTERMARAERDS